jgi:hypothetical protein
MAQPKCAKLLIYSDGEHHLNSENLENGHIEQKRPGVD